MSGGRVKFKSSTIRGEQVDNGTLEPHVRQLILFVFAPMILAACAGAWANDKTDVVTLYNGDRITGEVKSLEGGILSVSTDSMGTVKIEWQDIARLESKYYHEVRTSDGVRYLGSIQPPEHPGQLRVTEPDGQHQLESLQVVGIRPIEDSVLDRLDLYFAAGYSYTRASDISQMSINTNISYENEHSRNQFTGRTNVTESKDETTKSSKLELDRAVWTDRTNVFRSTFGNFETNDELGLDSRVGVGMGLGRFLVDNSRNRLVGIVGLQVITEENKSSGSDQNVELLIASRYVAWRFNSPELDLDFGLNLYPSLTDTGRWRSSSDLRLRWELISDLFLDITAYGTYDNKADSNSGLDYGVTTGLGWDF